ncbi:MAG: hypothetical protein FJ148_10135 [Deltaproteobacteria bacterium]|nr:hypothetical protein [Deltaproteobacteria bacterium]
MSSAATSLLVTGVLCLALVAFAACAALVIHHAFGETLRAGRERRAKDALLLLAPFIVDAEQLSEIAMVAVGRFGRGPVADVLRRARNDLSGSHGIALTAALERIGEVRRLRRLARSRFTARRRTAIRHLGECGGAAACEALAGALGDAAWQVRRAARDGLLTDASAESIRLAVESYLAEEAKSLGWQRAFYARFALVAPEQLCPLVRSGTLSSDEEKHAIDALGHARVGGAIPLVRPRLSAEDPELRASAARFVGKLGDAASVPALVRVLADAEWFSRAAAARALETVEKPAVALAALGACLHDRAWWVRTNAARTLARANDLGLGILGDAIDGADPYARDAALTALATHRVRGTARPAAAETARPRTEVGTCRPSPASCVRSRASSWCTFSCSTRRTWCSPRSRSGTGAAVARACGAAACARCCRTGPICRCRSSSRPTTSTAWSWPTCRRCSPPPIRSSSLW